MSKVVSFVTKKIVAYYRYNTSIATNNIHVYNLRVSGFTKNVIFLTKIYKENNEIANYGKYNFNIRPTVSLIIKQLYGVYVK